MPPVRILLCGYAENFPPSVWYHPNRISPFWRLYWGASEGATLCFADRRLHLDAQSVVFIPPNIPFGTEAEKPFSQLFIHFDWNGGPAFSEPLIFSAAEERELLHSAQSWYETPEESVALHMHALLFRCLTRVLSVPAAGEKKIDPRIEQAISLLDDWDRNLSLAEIARMISMSYYHFMETFRKQVGLPPGQYRMTQRMNFAQFLLHDAELPIEEIAWKTGFANRFHFSKAFKHFFNLSPGAYRKSLNETSHPLESVDDCAGTRKMNGK